VSYSKTFSYLFNQVAKEKKASHKRYSKTEDFLFPTDYTWCAQPWKPAVKIPQLEELISAFKGTEVPIAGGAVLGAYLAVAYGDVDIFPLSKTCILTAQDTLVNLGYKRVDDFPHCDNFEHPADVYRKVQVIKAHTDIYAGNLESKIAFMLSRFDLSICQIAVLNGETVSNRTALNDMKTRTLRCTDTVCLASLMHRIEKYKKRGFKIIDEEDFNEHSKQIQ